MRLSKAAFRREPFKVVTVIGMSGIGKTTLAERLGREGWFHYSADYQIGSCYLADEIAATMGGDAPGSLKKDNIRIISDFLGRIGKREKDGLPLEEFKRRQALYRAAEIQAARDLPDLIKEKAASGLYRHMIHDTAGSLCELDDEHVLKTLAEHSVIVYMQAGEEESRVLYERALAYPKPYLYHERFLDESLALYLQETSLSDAAQIDPAALHRWIFPRLFEARIPKYERIAKDYGYTIPAHRLADTKNSDDFIALLTEYMDD